MKIRLSSPKLFAACALLVLQNAAGAEDAPEAKPVPPEVIAEFDIAKGGDVIVLPVTIADRPYPFLLSIASYRTTVDSRLRPLLGKRIEHPRDRGDGIETTLDEFPPIPMRIGEFAFTSAEPLVCRSFHRDRAFLGHDIYGIVGMDFLKDRIVEIDFDKGKLRVLGDFPRPFPPDAELPSIWQDERRSAIYLKPPGMQTEMFALDTTFLSPVSLRSSMIDELVKNKLMAGTQEATLLWPVAAARPRAGWLKALTLERWALKNLWVVEGRCNSIGLPILSQFRLVFDFRVDAVLLTPGAMFGQRLWLNWSGMDFLLQEGAATVVRVEANRPASTAGIQPGDVLVEANGKPAREWSLFEIRRLFMEQKTVRARFHRPEQESRGAEEFTVSFENPKITISQKEIIPAGGTDDSKP